MLEIVKIEKLRDFPKLVPKHNFVDFLYNHLGEHRDKMEDITKSINYAFSKEEGKGGFLLLALLDKKLIGGAVVNDTAMSGYIPQHILVYIVTHKNYRGKGIGTKLMSRIKNECEGDIALHVEYDNPAYRLYKKAGFKSKYAEMRYKQKDS